MRYKFKRKRKHFKTYQIFLILIIFLIAISTSYALYTTQLIINGTATGNQEQFGIMYISMGDTSAYPKIIGYMDTYEYTFAIPPVIHSITMGGISLESKDYTYINGTLTIPKVTADIVIQGNGDATGVNVTFDIDGNTNTITIAQGQTVNKPQSPLKQGYGFLGWVDSNDNYFDFSTPIMEDITLYAKWIEGKVAEIDGTYYETLNAAIAAVGTNNTETTIKILTNINENNTIAQGKNIVLNIQDFTIGNDISNEKAAFIENNGTIKIINGNINTTGKASTINNNATGKIIITGGNLISTGEKSVIYNLGGSIEISGDAYLSSETSGAYNNRDRGTIQNLQSGSLTITGGTIVGVEGPAISSDGTFILGTEGDGQVSRTSPVIIGKNYGIRNYNTFYFYDGIVKGGNKAFYNQTQITGIETGYNILNNHETINNTTYQTAYLSSSSEVIIVAVTFDANEGTCSENIRNVEKGTKVGNLPTPTRDNHIFYGWYTAKEDGEKISKDTIVNEDITFYAHWLKATVAVIDEIEYSSLDEAISAVPTDNTETTIQLLKDTTGNFTIAANQNIKFDLQNHTITGNIKKQVFVNKGTIKISNGEIIQTGAEAAIDNETNGTIIMTGGKITSTGGKAALYNKSRGTIEISGNVFLSSNASGFTTDKMERGTVQNLVNGIIKITGGTIEGTAGFAVSNYGTLTLGEKSDGNIDNTSPIVIGKKTYGLNNATNGTFKYYDGIIKGITDAITGTITEQEDNSQIVDGTETIDGTTYKTAYLELSE